MSTVGVKIKLWVFNWYLLTFWIRTYFQKKFQHIRKTLTTFSVKLLDECQTQNEMECILRKKGMLKLNQYFYWVKQGAIEYNYTSGFTFNSSSFSFGCQSIQK